MTRRMSFAKMSGAGNDFVVFGPDEAEAIRSCLPSLARTLCRRGHSVGADGVLVVEPSPGGAVLVRFANPDGTEAFCGNGSRCAARFAWLRGFGGRDITLSTIIGDVPAVVAEDLVTLRLPRPEDRGRVVVTTELGTIEGRLLWAGVPHFVAFVGDLPGFPLATLGPSIRRSPEFGPEGANVNVVARLPDGSLGIRTYERGVEGETLSCGSGALAAAACAARGHESLVRVVPTGGIPLRVDLAADRDGRIGFSGDARLVFEGVLAPDAISLGDAR